MSCLPVVAISTNGIIAVHGGIPNSDIESINILNSENGEIYAKEMTWNDPAAYTKDRESNSRGDSYTSFGEAAFNNFMNAVPARIMIRAHEFFEMGFRLMFGKRLATIFSTGGKGESSAFRLRVTRPVFFETDLGKVKEQFEESDFIEILYT